MGAMRRLVLTPALSGYNAIRHVAWYLSYQLGGRRGDE
jgi:hypothetical protein